MARKKNVSKADYLSVSDFAAAVGVSSQAIYKRVARSGSFNNYVKTIDGGRYIHKRAIWEVYGVSYDGYQPEVEILTDDVESMTRELIKTQGEQLKAQAEQIRKQQDTISELMETLKAEQLLRANADQRIIYLEALISHDREEAQKPEQENQEPEPAQVEPEQEKEEKPSFLNRLFRMFNV